MVQATLASMRHYCPNVPICLIVDGVFDVGHLEKRYDFITLRVPGAGRQFLCSKQDQNDQQNDDHVRPCQVHEAREEARTLLSRSSFFAKFRAGLHSGGGLSSHRSMFK